MYMIYFVLHDPDRLDDVIAAWQGLGVSGITISESTGAYRRQVRRIPARYAFGQPRLTSTEQFSYTLVTIVPDRQAVQECIAAVERVVGNLDEPNTGVLAAWELDTVRGVPPTLRRPETAE